MSQSNKCQLLELVDGLCRGEMSASEYSRLEALLRSDAEARNLYCDYLFMHADLFGHFVVPHVDWEPSSLAPVTSSSAPVAGRPRSARTWYRTAAMVTAIAVLLAVAVRWSVRFDDPPSLPAPSHRQQAIGQITATRDCRWRDAQTHWEYGSTVTIDRPLALAAGLVEVTLLDGTVVLIEGPAAVAFQEPSTMDLTSGRIYARVPGSIPSFTVVAQDVTVRMKEAELGMVVDPTGGAELHAFHGGVEVETGQASGQLGQKLTLSAHEALRVKAAAAMFVKMVAQTGQFVRSMDPASGPHHGLYAYEAFDYPSGPLAWQNGGFGWAGPWESIDDGAPVDAPSNRVALGNLVYPHMASHGNRAVQSQRYNRIRRSLSTSLGGVFDSAGLVEDQDGQRLIGRDQTTVYVSFLQRVSHVNDVFYGVELHRGDGNSNRVLCIGNGADGCGYGATSNFNRYGVANFPSLGVENTDVNLVVVRIDYGPHHHDVLRVYRNPVSLYEESLCHVDAVLEGNFAFDRLSCGNYDGVQKVHEMDEVRVGTTFISVAGRQVQSHGTASQSDGPTDVVPEPDRL